MGFLDGLLGFAGDTPVEKLADDLAPMLAPGETLQRAFTFVRDAVVFTDRRLLLLNRQGLTAKKTEYRSIPYRHIVMHSLETAGHLQLDATLRVWVSGQAEPVVLELGDGKGSDALPGLIAQFTPA